ncbi:MAG: hypothetical protein IJ315_09095 [Firmicutes bacterium]|nr:hypothetical protein [Bacillota bacterium]
MRTLQQVITELSNIPAGCLISRTDRPTPRYFYHYYDHGDRHQPQVPEHLVAQAIAMDKHLAALMEELSFHQKRLAPENVRQLANEIRANRQRVLARIIADHRPYTEKHNIYTLHGDYVASKTQALLSMILDKLKVKYHYKKPLYITKTRSILPTFTLMINGKPYYYEHLGQFQDAEHFAAWQKRLQDYHSLGIYEGNQLLITTENDNILDLLKIQNTIQDFIRSKM